MNQRNDELGRQFIPKLTSEFGQRGHHSGRGSRSPYDPWWWPISPARTLDDWGLAEGQEAILSSLCEVPRNGGDYSGFGGSLVARPNCILILGERPSFNTSFGSAVSKLYKRLWTLGRVITPDEDRAPSNVHVCDLLKFRGQAGLIFDGPDPARIISLSMECLNAELDYLQPVVILRTDLAKKAMRKVRREYGQLSSATFKRIEDNAALVEVVHWSSNNDPWNWPQSLRTKLEADQNLSHCVLAAF